MTGHGAAVTGCKQDRQRTCDVILKRRRVTTGAECYGCVFVALVIQHVKRVRRTILSDVAFLLLFFHIIS